jgi:hypothetical protein
MPSMKEYLEENFCGHLHKKPSLSKLSLDPEIKEFNILSMFITWYNLKYHNLNKY